MEHPEGALPPLQPALGPLKLTLREQEGCECKETVPLEEMSPFTVAPLPQWKVVAFAV